MNHCVLMAEIVKAPQLRYTSDSQTPIAEFIIQFPGLRSDDPPSQLKAIGWGNLAQEIQEGYKEGDRVVLEGRLKMDSVDRPEGFKEKRAELTVRRIYGLSALQSLTLDTAAAAPTASISTQAAPAAAQTPVPATSSPAEATDYDEIPF
ncbi:single-stranded DNA-binding protein [Romeria aff. gracilis LEGE 07310]|uniref:Single-stranded DNA-binding protein n=1 Tax=Vasconcelosia minhoensis LEGE 07310 TaxID=915328 RepID=A0A8J7A7I9_9CYAN|nr:single-stranded DNA-binding protein [Romeria gracilis]MBE9078377.1 single-stranded DNA-binding protein [Romeria aff. gracilis LEGE 07310]